LRVSLFKEFIFRADPTGLILSARVGNLVQKELWLLDIHKLTSLKLEDLDIRTVNLCMKKHVKLFDIFVVLFSSLGCTTV